VAPPNLLVWPDPLLSSRSAEVEKFDDELAELAEQMCNFLKGSDNVGISAVQFGVPLRVVVIALEETGKRLVLVNPTVEPEPSEKGAIETIMLSVEGCLSVPGVVARLKDKRVYSVRVAATGLDGMPVVTTLRGRDAVAAQHEVDHLDGITILDRMPRVPARLAKERLKRRSRRK